MQHFEGGSEARTNGSEAEARRDERITNRSKGVENGRVSRVVVAVVMGYVCTRASNRRFVVWLYACARW